jgi:hypothetical protein
MAEKDRHAEVTDILTEIELFHDSAGGQSLANKTTFGGVQSLKNISR